MDIYNATTYRTKEHNGLRIKVGIEGAVLAGQEVKEGELCWVVEFDKTGEEITFKGIPKTFGKERQV